MLYTNGKKFLGVIGGQNQGETAKHCFAVPKIHASMATNKFNPAYVKNGYGFEDGKIKGSTLNDATNSSAYYNANCTSYAVLTSGGIFDSTDNNETISTNYCLTSDITISASKLHNEDKVFSGILDGCGHTLTIENTQSGNWTSAHDFGALIGTLTGTIKNIKIVTKFYWQNGSICKVDQFVGGVCGRINGGNLENVYVETDYYTGQSYNMNYTKRPEDGYTRMVGGIAGQTTGNASFTNVTVKIANLGWRNGGGVYLGWRPNAKCGCGGFIGYVRTGTSVTMKNVRVCGTGVISVYFQDADVYGFGHAGGFVALNDGSLSFENVINEWSGSTSFTTNVSSYKEIHECSMVGRSNGSFVVSNAYNADNSYAITNGYFEWKETQTFSTGQKYSNSLNGKIGFLGDDLWIGDKTALELKTLTSYTDIHGSYMDSIAFTNNTEVVFEQLKEICIKDYVIIKIRASELNSEVNILQSINYGYFAYLTNIQGSASGKFRLYYNNGNYIDYQFSGNTPHRVGIYDIYERLASNNQSYHITKNTNIGYYS